MQTSGPKQIAAKIFGRVIVIALFALSSIQFAYSQLGIFPTTINITDTAKLNTAKRIGLVLGNQDFYDSGQFMRNISFRNPGFEGEIWQTIFHCEYVTANSCTDDDLYTYWPANFMANGKAEFIVGSAVGETATVASSTAAVIGSTGVKLTFASLSKAPSVGDYVVVRMSVAGNAQAGWWPQGTAGTKYTTEFTDLSPNTQGKQALRITQGPSDLATLAAYMDSVTGRSFLQLNGSYTLTFRAKSTGGNNQLNVSFSRAVTAPPAANFFNQNVSLSTAWKDYTYTFTAHDSGQVGILALKFFLDGGSMIIDDVALTAAADSDNPTVYRNEVVSTLKELKPGILRFMDSGTDWGSTIDNMLQPDFVRERAGYTNRNAEMDDIPLNLHDYLVLCQTIGAEPWYTMPTGMSTQEMSNLMDYFGGSTSTEYGARRAALGQNAPWTTVFPKIHLEFGNEVWNVSNPGATMNDALSYGKRASVIFTTAKNSPSYNAKVFDLVQDGMEANPWWTQQALSTSTNYDTVDSTAYIFSNLNDSSSTEAIYGSMFAEPEFLDSTAAGQVSQLAAVAAGANPPARLAIYEMNMGTNTGTATQAVVNSTVAGAGAGIAVGVNSLLLLRDLGVTDQNMFALQGLNAPFNGTGANAATNAPIWGTVVDMGGTTNLRRPTFLSQMMTNNAILPTLLSTSQTGANPTWNQAYTTNDNFSLAGAHYIQSFAFTDGNKLNIILFNLSRTTALPINFAGLNTPLGAAAITTLYSPGLSATNEATETVVIKNSTQTLVAGSRLMLAPYSMTVVSVDAPLVPVLITSLTASCANASLSAGGHTTCTANVVGQGKYNTNVNWSVDVGTIDANGNYAAPATLPPSGRATITAISAQDATKRVAITELLARDAITGVTASCAAPSVGEGQTVACTARVAGTGGFSPAYTWTTSAGTIMSNGTVTAPATGNSLVVTATSTQDPTKSGSVTLALTQVLIMGAPKASSTSTTATIGWTLNAAAHSGISYGPTQALGLSTGYIPTPTANPSFTLTGLKPGTTYYMAVYSFMNGQTTQSPFTVTTATGSSSITGISVACPSIAGLSLGGILGCTASLTGTGSYSAAVNWSISAGTISSSGLITAPLFGTSLTVTATSVQDRTKSASITIGLTGKATITSVIAFCTSNTVAAGATLACSPKVTGTGTFSSGVTWSTSAGTITSAGVLTAPATGTSVTVKATSTQDTTKYGTAVVAITSNSKITGVNVTCATASVAPGGNSSCAASVTGTGSFSTGVTWSISAGSITSAGVLTAPATGTGTSLTVTATSTQDRTKSASYTLAISSASTVSNVLVTCGATSAAPGTNVACTSKVYGTGSFSSAVTWTTTAGTISANGVLTLPTTGASATVRAISVQNHEISGVRTIAVAQGLAIVNPTFSATPTTIVVSYTVTQPTHNGVSYGPSPAYGATTPYDRNLITNPTYTFTGLQPGHTYYALLFSFNDNGAVTTPITITTPLQ